MKTTAFKTIAIATVLSITLGVCMASVTVMRAKAETYQGSRGKKSSKGKKADAANDEPCGRYKDKQLYKGPKGGCYYINDNNNKTYVDRGECKC